MLLGKDLIKIVTHAPLQFCSSKYHQHGFCASSIGTDMPLYIYVLREVNLCFFLEDSLFLGGLSEEKNILFAGGGGITDTTEFLQLCCQRNTVQDCLHSHESVVSLKKLHTNSRETQI